MLPFAHQSDCRVPRRDFLRLGAFGLGACALPMLCRAEVAETQYYRGNPNGTGYLKSTRLPTRPVVRWAYVTKAAGRGRAPAPHVPVATTDRVVYCGDDVGRLYALSAEDGAVIWIHEHGEGQIYTAPTIADDLVYFTCTHGVAAVTFAEGKLQWEYEIPRGAGESAPLPIDNALCVGGKDGKIYAFDGRTREDRWTLELLADKPAAPSPEFDSTRANHSSDLARPRIASTDGTTLYQPIFDQSRLVAVDCKTGRLSWSFQAKGWIYGQPAVTDMHVFIGSQDKNLYCLNKATGAYVWSFPTNSRIEAGVAVHDGSVFFGSCDGVFYRLDATTGEAVWSFKSGRNETGSVAIYSSPLLTDDTVYFGSLDGNLYALNRATGELVWRICPFEGAEVVSTPCTDGRSIFITTRRNSGGEGENAIVAIGDAK